MADVFTRADLLREFGGKSVLFLGDSLMRSIYKDFVFLSMRDAILPYDINKDGRYVFAEEKLIRRSDEGYGGRDYEELRDYYIEKDNLQFTFLFITRCFTPMLKDFLKNYPEEFGSFPDLILVNSALWDINRWGPNGVEAFMENIDKLFDLFDEILPADTQVCFVTTPPISVDIQSGFLIEQLEFQRYSMRFYVVEANHFAARVAASYGFDVIDLHYHFLHQVHHRCADGLHWKPDGVRLQTNIILTHYCLAHDHPLPGNVDADNAALLAAKRIADNALLEDGEEEAAEIPVAVEDAENDTAQDEKSKEDPAEGTAANPVDLEPTE